MPKRIKIRVFPDGHVQADIEGVKGKKCLDYIRVLEDVLDAESVASEFTPEFYEPAELAVDAEVVNEETDEQQIGLILNRLSAISPELVNEAGEEQQLRTENRLQ